MGSNPTGFKIVQNYPTNTIGYDFDDLYVRKDNFLSGGLWSWGDGSSGQLGENNSVSRCSPVQVSGSGMTWRKICASRFSGNNVIALACNGKVYAWGLNGDYQLGDGTVTTRSSPVNPTSNSNYKEISTGGGSSSVLGVVGRSSWGCNSNQRIGINCANTTVTAVTSADTVLWRQLSHGNGFAVGVGQIGGQDTTSDLIVFGVNTAGQLGTSNTTTVSIPTRISSGWLCVSAGNNHSLGVKEDGTLWAWGCNSFGQLGTGDTTNRSSPVQIGCDKYWKSVSAGGDFSVAVTCGSQNTFHSQIWTWGLNSSGQLGDNTTTNRSTPVQTVDCLNSWKRVSAGDSHVLALNANGTVWAWGTNSCGELGDGTLTGRSSPVQMVGGSNKWFAISAGKCFSVGIRESCW